MSCIYKLISKIVLISMKFGLFIQIKENMFIKQSLKLETKLKSNTIVKNKMYH